VHDLARTVLVEEAHHGVAGKTAEVSRVLVSRDILASFSNPTHMDWQATVGRRRYFDITDSEVRRHMVGSLDYPSRSQREEEVRQRNINLLEWLWEDLLGKSYLGTGTDTDTEYGVYLTTGERTRSDLVGAGLGWVGSRLLWHGPGWYHTEHLEDDNGVPEESVTKWLGGDIRDYPQEDDILDIYIHWLNAPVGERGNVLEDADGR
jgi:hypothetical protein